MDIDPKDTDITHTILRVAAQTIQTRASDRDLEEERSMAGTVAAFNAIYGTNLSESQGWGFMVLLKIKRSSVGPFKGDDYVDMAAYGALLGESRAGEDARAVSLELGTAVGTAMAQAATPKPIRRRQKKTNLSEDLGSERT